MNLPQGHIVSTSSEAVIVELSGGNVLTAAVDAGQLRAEDLIVLGILPDDVTLGNGVANPMRWRDLHQLPQPLGNDALFRAGFWRKLN